MLDVSAYNFKGVPPCAQKTPPSLWFLAEERLLKKKKIFAHSPHAEFFPKAKSFRKNYISCGVCGKCKYYNIAFTSTILYCRKTISKDNPITRSKNFQNVWCIFPLNPRPGRFANHTWVKRSTQPGNRNRLGKTVWARSGLALRKNKQFGRRAATGEQNSFERRAAQGWAFGKNSFEPHGAAQGWALGKKQLRAARSGSGVGPWEEQLRAARSGPGVGPEKTASGRADATQGWALQKTSGSGRADATQGWYPKKQFFGVHASAACLEKKQLRAARSGPGVGP